MIFVSITCFTCFYFALSSSRQKSKASVSFSLKQIFVSVGITFLAMLAASDENVDLTL